MAKESPPAPPAGSAPLSMVLIGLGTAMRERLDERLSADGITTRHFGALGHLANSPELSTSDLARRVRVTPQSMRATVDHLEALGAIEHRRHGQGKASELVVTDHGRRLLERARDVVAEVDDDLLGEIDDRDGLRDTLAAALIDIRHGQRPSDVIS